MSPAGNRRQVHALRQAGVQGHHQVLVHRLREEGQDRRKDARKGHQGGVERRERVVPVDRAAGRNAGTAAAHAVPRQAQVPRRDIVDERRDLARRCERVVVAQPGLHAGREPRRARQDPAIERGPGRSRTVGRVDPFGRRPAGQARIGDEERVDVPEHEQLAPGLVGHVPAEQDVLLGPRGREDPPHDVDAHPLGGLVEVDGVAPRLVHRAAVFTEHQCIAKDRLERRLAPKDRRHREQAVEPVPELAREALRDEVGREPLGPVAGLLAVVERRERHDSGIQPWIANVGNSRDRLAA